MIENQYGRSMVEMLGVLAIIGVLSVGGITGYTKAMQKYKNNKSIEQISTIITNIKSLGMKKRTFEGITANAAIKLNAIPDEMVRTTTDNKKEIRNVYDGAVIIGTKNNLNDISGHLAKNFYVQFQSLPKQACLEIASQDWGSEKIAVMASKTTISPSVTAIKTESSCSTNGGTTTCWNQIMTPSAATAGCGCTTNSCSVTIWTF